MTNECDDNRKETEHPHKGGCVQIKRKVCEAAYAGERWCATPQERERWTRRSKGATELARYERRGWKCDHEENDDDDDDDDTKRFA
ncbi:hypothetical protein RUM44_011561 [Polyplax serrata]|uniref:Uncharacterized protein n=1 Tax=Polyplax serrata TaxID=468196 RepID=A0ABR1AQE5_POLSC